MIRIFEPLSLLDGLNWVRRTGGTTSPANPCPRRKSPTLSPGWRRSGHSFRASHTQTVRGPQRRAMTHQRRVNRRTDGIIKTRAARQAWTAFQRNRRCDSGRADPALPCVAGYSRAESQVMSRGSLLADWNSFLQARPGSLHFGIPLPIPGMAKRQIFLAGLETWTGRISRSSPSIARTWDVRFAGSRSPTSSCVRATAAFTIPDGSHAAGPPPRGLFQYHYRIEDGKLFIKGGEMPTTGSPHREHQRK